VVVVVLAASPVLDVVAVVLSSAELADEHSSTAPAMPIATGTRYFFMAHLSCSRHSTLLRADFPAQQPPFQSLPVLEASPDRRPR
jgi:hypothetical protein